MSFFFSPTCKIESLNFQLVSYLDRSSPLTLGKILGYPVAVIGASITTVGTLIIGIIESIARTILGVIASPYLLSAGKFKEYFKSITLLCHVSVMPFINIIKALAGKTLFNFNAYSLSKPVISIGQKAEDKYTASVQNEKEAVSSSVQSERKEAVSGDIQAEQKEAVFERVVPIEQRVEDGCIIDDQIKERISFLYDKILWCHKYVYPGITCYSTSRTFIVFSLDIAPHMMFKMSRSPWSKDVENRYNEVLKAKEICKSENLNLLHIPKTTLCTIKGEAREVFLIVEEKLEAHSDIYKTHELLLEAPAYFNETFRQITILICKLGATDINKRNMMIFKKPELIGGSSYKVALPDLEDTLEATFQTKVFVGLLGCDAWCSPREGLISCLSSKEQLQIVCDETDKHFPEFSEKYRENIIEMFDKRLRDIDEFKKLNAEIKAFHETQKTILNAEIPFIEIELSPSEIEGVQQLMPADRNSRESVCNLAQNVHENLLKEINYQITREGKSKESIRLNRSIKIQFNKALSNDYKLSKKVYDSGAAEAYTALIKIFLEKFRQHNLIFSVERVFEEATIQA